VLKLITSNMDNCVGCNRCIRACPIEGASYVISDNGQLKVSVQEERCIACGSCIDSCRHDVRDYIDDTERFLQDLRNGAAISMIVAPANRMNGQDGGRLLTWLKQQGVKKIYDVSLGADICTWAHIRLIQRDKPRTVITQPCPAIVNFIQYHEHSLLKYLSPVHSPMLCTAIYMNKHDRITDSIAALSPCVAKSNEFEETGYVKYNVTLKKLWQYIQDNDIPLPAASTGFDPPDSALGRLYSMPGGLKENVEFYFGKRLRVDQAEGPHVVYEALKAMTKESALNLPAVFDVLNCAEGCNIGTGVTHDRTRFQTSAIMDQNRQNVLDAFDHEQYERLFLEYDHRLRLDDYLRKYRPKAIKQYATSNDAIKKAFAALRKETESERKFDCGACGSDSCADMAKRIALGFDTPENCLKMLRDEVMEKSDAILKIATSNKTSIEHLTTDMSDIKSKSTEINSAIETLNSVIERYRAISSDILSISTYINLISLNASVEAARAGDHGKTFAVVAQEIRSLAHKTKTTVSESEVISGLAAESIDTVTNMVSTIMENLEKSYISISIIDQSLTNTMRTFDEVVS
jgi:iron only hydrogenase large subunit-like protein